LLDWFIHRPFIFPAAAAAAAATERRQEKNVLVVRHIFLVFGVSFVLQFFFYK
jgi:hypothetical protein